MPLISDGGRGTGVLSSSQIISSSSSVHESPRGMQDPSGPQDRDVGLPLSSLLDHLRDFHLQSTECSHPDGGLFCTVDEHHVLPEMKNFPLFDPQ